MSMFDLQGKVAIVTGANTGLGQGIACGLAEYGAKVVCVGRSDMAETEKLLGNFKAEFLSVYADLSSTASIPGIIKKALEKFGRIDILCNNAGIIRREDAIDFSELDWDDVMNTNLKTAFFLSQAVAREFIKQGSKGKIVNVASLLSFQGGIRVPSYCASKSGLRGLTMALANEWGKFGININAIAPGYMVTNNTTALQNDPVRYGAIIERIPMGRWGTPDDIKGPAVFLSSRASDYVNGYTIAVDGGWLGR